MKFRAVGWRNVSLVNLNYLKINIFNIGYLGLSPWIGFNCEVIINLVNQIITLTWDFNYYNYLKHWKITKDV